MKLIDKLACDCSEKLWGVAMREDPPFFIAEDAFRAGFRAAREMAAKECERLIEERAFKVRAITVGHLYHFPEAIRAMGEDETND